VVWSVWAIATFATIWYIRHHGRNLPMFEDLMVVPVMTGHEPVSIGWAATQANEHRPVIPKLILVTLLRAIPDFRAGLYLNAGLLSAAAASMIVVVRRLRGWTSAVDAVLPLSILNIGQCECLLLGFALNLVMTACISWGLIGAVGRATKSPGWWPCLQVGGFLVLLPLCGGSGIVMIPSLVLWLAGYVACGWWSGQDPSPSARALSVGLLAITSAVVAWYMTGYVRPVHIPATPSVGAAWSTTLEFLSLVIVPSGWGSWQPAGWAFLLLSAVTILRLAIVAQRSPAERPRALGLIAVMVAMLGVAASVGLSRSGLGPGVGLSSRYITISAPALSVVYVAWLIYGPASARRAIHIGLLALVCAGIPAQIQLAHALGGGRRSQYVNIERGLRGGMPTSRLLDRACPALFPDRAVIYGAFKMLKAARVGNFRYLVDDGLAAKSDSHATVR
jgi:hypothetical protein